MACVNRNIPEFKELAKQFGENLAESLVVRNNYIVPTKEEAVQMIRGSKVLQFKKALRYLATTVSSNTENLLQNMNHILHRVGDDIYVVKGARVGEPPAPLADQEVGQANTRFITNVNNVYPDLFTLVPERFQKVPSQQTTESISAFQQIPVVAGQTVSTRTPTSKGVEDFSGVHDLVPSTAIAKQVPNFYKRVATTVAGYDLIRGKLKGKIKAVANLSKQLADLQEKISQVKVDIAKLYEKEYRQSTIKNQPSLFANADVDVQNNLYNKLVAQRNELNQRLDELTSTLKEKDLDRVINQYKEAVKSNLRWLYDNMSDTNRALAKQWYVGANRLAQSWARNYGISVEQGAGVMASLSPQKDWFMNVALAERTIQIYNANKDKIIDKNVYDQARKITKPEEYRDFANTKGKKVQDLTPKQKAIFIRAFDEANNDRSYYIVHPEGAKVSLMTKSNGDKATYAWGSYNEIQKAINILSDGSIANVSRNVGLQHKVRNFYNNIVDPASQNGYATIDTHAVAAAELKPHSGNSAEVQNNFGLAGSSDITGMSGTYFIYLEAYQELARELGMLPRELQGVTWENVRSLFDTSSKQRVNTEEKINNIWQQYVANKISIEDARNKIKSVVGGFNPFTWETGFGVATNANIKSAANANELFNSAEPSQSTTGRFVRGALPGTAGMGATTAGVEKFQKIPILSEIKSIVDSLGEAEITNNEGEGMGFYISKTDEGYELTNSLGKITNKYKTWQEFENDFNVQNQEYFQKLPQEEFIPEVINGFYSPIEKRLGDFKQEKASVQKWKDIVGMKTDEAIYTGAANYLNSLKPNEVISKKDIQDFMKNNRITITPVVLGTNGAKQVTRSNITETKEDANYYQIYFDNGAKVPIDKRDNPHITSLADAMNVAIDDVNSSLIGFAGGTTKYEKYTQPGEKSNYQEVLITLPNISIQAIENYNKSFDEYNKWVIQVDTPTEAEKIKNDEWVNRNKELKSKLPANVIFQQGRAYFINKDPKDKDFIDNHFDEPNIVVHLRIDIRTDQDGNRVLFIEEIQSGWGQKGKREGFGEDKAILETKQKLKFVEGQIKDNEDRLQQVLQRMKELGLPSNPSSTELRMFEAGENAESRKLLNQLNTIKNNRDYDAVQTRIDEIVQELRTVSRERRNIIGNRKILEETKERLIRSIEHYKGLSKTVPSAPFVTDTNAWVKLALKYALQQAVQEGVNKVAWSTGDQQNELYDLSKQVDSISYAFITMEKSQGYLPEGYSLGLFKDGVEIQTLNGIAEDKLEDYVGKEIAQKIIAGEGKSMHPSGEVREGYRKRIEGENLKVGGKGMIGFYGDPSQNKLGIVGNVAKSVFKQEPGLIRLNFNEAAELLSEIDYKIEEVDGKFEIVEAENAFRITQPFNTREAAQTWIDNEKAISEPEYTGGSWFEITDEDGKLLWEGNGDKTYIDNKATELENKINAPVEVHKTNPPTGTLHSITITPELRQEVEKGLPLFQKAGRNLFNENNPETKQIADQYKLDKGIETANGQQIYSLDTDLSKRIADAYEVMKDDPTNPQVLMAYEAMATETVDQFDAIQNAGYAIEIFEGSGEPYKNSDEMITDVRENKHQYILSTEKDFGTTPITDQQRLENPLLRDSERKDVNGKPLLVNDIFRFVHDFFGHTERGNSFGPVGEENAWDVHARMYTDLARRAMTSETRGQNSWVNFGPHARNENGELIKKGESKYLDIVNRPFAEQKAGLLPEEFSQIRNTDTDFNKKPVDNKVNINQDVLNQIADKNKAAQEQDFFKEPSEKTTSEYEKETIRNRNYSLNNIMRMLTAKYGVQFGESINDPRQKWRGKFSQGKVILNEAYIRPDTAFHEVFHAIMPVLQKTNPSLYNALINELSGTEEGRAELAQVVKDYPELSEAEQRDEALVSLLGKKSAAHELSKGVWQQFLDWLKTLLTDLGIRTTGFRTDMSIDEFSRLITDPLHSYDLEKALELAELDDRYSKVADVDTQLKFDALIKDTIRKLRADANIPGKTKEEKTRKFFSERNAKILEENPKDIENLDKYIISALTNLKSITNRFAEFKEIYSSQTNRSKEDIARLASLLREIEDNVTLYNTVTPLIDSIMEMFPDEETNFGNLSRNLKREKQLIQEYKLYGATLVADWLYPYMRKAVVNAQMDGNIFSVVTKSVYDSVKAKLNDSGVVDPNVILEHAVKEDIKEMLLMAKQDASGITTYLGAILTSRDPITAAVGLALTDETMKAIKNGHHIHQSLEKLLKDHRGNTLFTDNKQEREFHEKYLRKAQSWEYQGLGKDLKPVYKYVDRTAFHEEYFWDTFYNNKREFFDKLGPQPSKLDVAAWQKWKSQSDAWWNSNTVKTTVGGKESYIPATQYKNPQFQQLIQDPYYAGLYSAYKDANFKIGNQNLRYGIIPQDRTSGVKINKLAPKNILDTIRDAVGEEEQVYYAENINGLERQTVPIAYTHLLDDEKELSFNLANSVSKFAMSANKYNAIIRIEPHVQVLKNFVGGNTALTIDKRKAFQTSSAGLKSLTKGERQAIPIEAKNLNKQLNAFLDDIVYGQSLKKETIQLWDAKFRVQDKNNTGQDKTIHGFENLREYLNLPDLDYTGFKSGEQREIGDNIVTMTRKDWNFSVKKTANNLGLLTAFQLMVLNPVSAVINLLRGKIETYVEASGGKYFNLKEMFGADAEYSKRLFSGDFINDLKGGKPSFLGSMNIRYETIQGELQNPYGNKLQPGVANKLFRRSHLFFMQNGGEHQIQTSLMIAMMKHKQVALNNGTKMSLYEARQREFEGKLSFADVKWSEDEDRGFKETLGFVNKQLNGNYDKLDKAYLQRTWWGQQLMMFRKHIYNGFANRYRKGYVDYSGGKYTEGYYRSFFNGFLREVQDMILDGKIRKFNFTEQEKYAFRKLAADMATIALMMFAFKMFDDDDADNEVTDSFALVARRLITEGVQYTPIVGTFDLARVVTNPTASANVIEQYYKAIKQTVTGPTDVYERSGPGYEQGELKWKAYWGRLVPAYRQYVNTLEPERMLEFYQKNSIWFLKPDPGKKTNP